MRIDFKTEDGYEYAKTRFFEMSALDAESADVAAAYERIKNQINIRAAVCVFDNAINGAKINLGGEIIECPPILNTRGRLYAYALTVGELKLSESTLERTLEDMWGTAFVDAGLELLRNKITEDNPEKCVSYPFGPGFYGIKINAVETIYNALDCEDSEIGLKNGLLSPMKSSIGFFLVSDNKADLPLRDCISCVGDTSCEYCKNSNKMMSKASSQAHHLHCSAKAPKKQNIKIRFANENITVTVPAGTMVIEAARQAGIVMETPCGGLGQCGKCKGIIEINGDTKIARLCILQAHEDMTVYTKAGKLGDTKISVSVFGDGEYGNYSLAIDIGTTTLEAALVGDAQIIARASCINPQAMYCADVIGRIRLASEGDALHALIIGAINSIIDELICAVNIVREQIAKCVIAGNTAMQCIAAGTNPQSLGTYPYTVPDAFGRSIVAADLGINIPCEIYFPPVISAFVGGDIACGIACTRLWERDKTLLIDIGTNGELVYIENGKMTAASAAAGPAFEGAGITFGMRADGGAVSRFKIENRSTVMAETINKESAVGICGSGLLEIIAELYKYGIITDDGAFCDKMLITSPIRYRLREYNGETAFGVCGGVYLTQNDIRQVQLAKGAIRAAVEAAGKDAEHVIIAGAFGKHTSEDALIGTGILPEKFRGKIEFAGNTSLEGAIMLLDDMEVRIKLAQTVSGTETVMLSESDEFERLFVKYMNFGE